MTFAVTNLCSSRAELNDYNRLDKATLGIDIFVVAVLVSAVCLVVIGRVDLYVGPVGTLSNTSILVMLAAGGGCAVLDGIMIGIKACAFSSKKTGSIDSQASPATGAVAEEPPVVAPRPPENKPRDKVFVAAERPPVVPRPLENKSKAETAAGAAAPSGAERPPVVPRPPENKSKTERAVGAAVSSGVERSPVVESRPPQDKSKGKVSSAAGEPPAAPRLPEGKSRTERATGAAVSSGVKRPPVAVPRFPQDKPKAKVSSAAGEPPVRVPSPPRDKSEAESPQPPGGAPLNSSTVVLHEESLKKDGFHNLDARGVALFDNAKLTVNPDDTPLIRTQGDIQLWTVYMTVGVNRELEIEGHQANQCKIDKVKDKTVTPLRYILELQVKFNGEQTYIKFPTEGRLEDFSSSPPKVTQETELGLIRDHFLCNYINRS